MPTIKLRSATMNHGSFLRSDDLIETETSTMTPQWPPLSTRGRNREPHLSPGRVPCATSQIPDGSRGILQTAVRFGTRRFSWLTGHHPQVQTLHNVGRASTHSTSSRPQGRASHETRGRVHARSFTIRVFTARATTTARETKNLCHHLAKYFGAT